jgi:hypothetical protein
MLLTLDLIGQLIALTRISSFVEIIAFNMDDAPGMSPLPYEIGPSKLSHSKLENEFKIEYYL